MGRGLKRGCQLIREVQNYRNGIGRDREKGEERRTLLRYEFSVYFRQRRGAVCNTPLQLFSLEMVQDFPETWARLQSQRDKVAARKEWRVRACDSYGGAFFFENSLTQI